MGEKGGMEGGEECREDEKLPLPLFLLSAAFYVFFSTLLGRHVLFLSSVFTIVFVFIL